MVIIKVAEIITGKLDHEDGSILYHAISEHLKKNVKVEIDFSGIEILSSSFTNTSFRIFAREYKYEKLKDMLHIVNSNSTINRLIKDCFDTALQLKTVPINKETY